MDLAPNGLPYSIGTKSENEWCKFSKLLANLPTDTIATMHPHLVARQRNDVGGGMGIYAYYGIPKGEVVWAERAQAGPQITATPRSREWIEALPAASRKAYCHFMYKTGEDEYQSLAEFNDAPIDQFQFVRTLDVSNYMNHSCSPTCWFVQGGSEYSGLMVAAKDISPGEEITYDYCTSEDADLSPEWECHCGAAGCRKVITPVDWMRPELQQRYKGHFLDHIAAKIGAANGEPPTPLEECDVSASWWMRMRDGKLPRPASAKHAASGPELELLNRQAAVLIAEHGLRVRGTEHDAVGRYVTTSAPIAPGELVMLLPPNYLLLERDVKDFNQCLQLPACGDGTDEGRVFSSSLTPRDVDNFLCHSCDPNCEVVIGKDLAAALVATRQIAADEMINFDYDTTEDDLRGERGGFVCHCNSANCRGEVQGKLFTPQLVPST
ncbi:hypothetical protein AB1Y20_018662 [Prymnesium parvum]|uniref:SET domain-containing protein n=1 Tax=Prymnesium parvum TaxID=97485 RepID=A0AB34JSF1_PRYPA